MIKKFMNKLKLFYYQLQLNKALDSAVAKDDYRRGLNHDFSALGTAFGGSDVIEMEQESERLYLEALTQIKREVNNRIKAVTSENYDQTLKNIEDLTALANKEPNQLVETLKSIYVNKQQDVMTSEDKTKMVETRIQHYYELQKYNEEKQLLRQIKEAKKTNDTLTTNRLTKEWMETYGKRKYKN